MGKRVLILLPILLVGVLPFRTAPQTLQIAPSQNLQMCLEGFSACNASRLSPQERQAVKQSTDDDNFEGCLKLNAPEQKEVADAEYDGNLQNCLDGTGTCDRSSLTQDDRAMVVSMDQDRNLRDCVNGSQDCDRAQLAPDEPNATANAVKDRL
jgi:hypothetical protein